MKIALLSCPDRPDGIKCRARDMYSRNERFRDAFSYVKIAADRVFLLSSKYGLLDPDDEIEPVTEAMSAKPPYEKRLWAANVMDALAARCKPGEDEFIILAGKEYYEYLLDELGSVSLPLDGIPKEESAVRLRKLYRDEVEFTSALNAHRVLSESPEYTWDRIDDIPFSNGVYVMFEKGEEFKGYKRITRVGTHRGDGNLKSRLQTHFIREDKNWSIFRKNIGRAILNREGDPYLRIWDMVTGTPDARQRYADQIDELKENSIEKRVSIFLRNHVTFTCFEIESWYDRMRIEEGLIATLNRDPDFGPSAEWFGRYSPEYEIRNSGLWLKRGLDKVPLKRAEMEKMEEAVRNLMGTRTDGCSPDRVKELVGRKLQAASDINLRYIDIVPDDIGAELGGCDLGELTEAMKDIMGNRDEILPLEDTVMIRYFI